MESRKNPDGATLKQLLPADLYARWSVLRDKYIGDYQEEESDIERRRPMFAALELYDKAINKVGLTSTNAVRSAVEDLATASPHRAAARSSRATASARPAH